MRSTNPVGWETETGIEIALLELGIIEAKQRLDGLLSHTTKTKELLIQRYIEKQYRGPNMGDLVSITSFTSAGF